MRYTGPRNRLARREGMDLGLKTPGTKSHERLLKKLNVPPGQLKARSRRKLSDHSRQLREKQKLKYIYQVSETQLKKYFNKSIVKKGNTALHLAKLLEKRLDNILYRLGFAPTRASARQLIAHGHVKVNKGVVSIPSFQVNKGDIITFSDQKTMKIPYIEKVLANKGLMMPKWLEKKATAGKLIEDPNSDEIEKQINLRLVVEHYSR